MLARLFFGLYTKFSSNKLITSASKIFCICTILTVAYYNFKFYIGIREYDFSAIFLSAIILYIIYGLVSLLSDGENVYKYLYRLNKIGSVLIVELKIEKCVSYFYLYLFIGVIIGHSVKFIIFFMYSDTFKICHYILTSFLFIARSLSYFERVIIFEMTWNRMRSLRKTIRNNVDFSISEDEESNEIKKVQQYLLIYNKLLNNYRCIGKATKLMVNIT